MLKSRGTNPTKISAEANWFESLPAPMRCFTPSYLGRSSDEDPCWYRLEYLYQPTLTDLFVFGSLPDKTWDNILEACDDFLRECRTYKPVAEDVRRNGFDNALYGDKTLRRLIEYSTQSGCNLDLPCELNGVNLPSLREIAIASSAMITPLCYSSEVSFVHGDFCFSNIFYDFRSEAVRAIDPRGLDADNVQTCYGDIRYDIAKLFHSAVGYYDLIVAGYFSLRDHGDNRFDFTLTQHDAARYVATAFRRRTFAGLTLDQACAPAIGVQLFLSMLPLHKDDPIRQKALLANALRLFQELNSQNERHAVLETRVDL